MKGYENNFLGADHPVHFPNYSYYNKDVAVNNETGDALLPYVYYTVLQSRSRRVPVLSASNIYRTAFTKVARSRNFKKDSRVNDDEQLTPKDYSHFNSIKAAAIEKGHMTKREDVQWDEHEDEVKAEAAARSTFFYPNSSPQHDGLNNGVWKLLENSIIIKGRVPMPAKVCVFTGPVLDADDPLIKTGLADGTAFKIPVLFWKVVYYIKPDNKLYYAAFLMGQLNPLRRDKLITETIKRDFNKMERKSSLKPFLEFEEDEKYQVPVSLIEDLTHLQFHKALDLHKDEKPIKLLLKNVQVRVIENINFAKPLRLVENINV